MGLRIAVLVDGDNVAHAHADEVLARAADLGDVTLTRVYSDKDRTHPWNKDSRFAWVNGGAVSSKNHSDIMLVIGAMDMLHHKSADVFVIVSNDSDFTPLARRMQIEGYPVVGLGSAQAAAEFRAACSEFHILGTVLEQPELANLPPFDKLLRDLVWEKGGKLGLPLKKLNEIMRERHQFSVSTLPEKTWRAYLTARPTLFDCDPKGPQARVRMVK